MIKEIAILVYPGCMGMEVFALTDLVLMANHLAKNMHPGKFSALRVKLVTLRPNPVAIAGGFKVAAQRLRGKPDLIVVPGLEVSRFGEWDERFARLGQELKAIRRFHGQGTELASVCIGSFVLAEAGVLQGRRAATAWPFVSEFQDRYPDVQIEKDAVILSDGGVTTTGAVSSVMDLGLHLIRESMGSAVARAVSKLALIDGGRVSQRAYVDTALIPQNRAPFSTQVNRWLAQRLSETYNLCALADAFNVTSRTVLRRYRQETCMTPLQWLQKARIEKAKHLLELSSMSVAEVVVAVGYHDLATFSRLFARETGQTPGHYKRLFQGKRVATFPRG
ncbi:AraC family transcriptional regulator [Hylemonella gracilis str. Niagara R]|uniref:AraC family transcriptional regulator n=1 Tax=Hylemonella gracilis str. Niagara R TaxID=1458275 RepID=A0A016XF40_9BURK|nr:helix-turn-helix domain-containing protein [Hylemonella gracilis]EYC50704.1 AraC family transcriptional regulator [Hylemonella gracilis str. Niagara R]MDF3822405.1 helix-turn-helix domain-containing protein [Leptospira sp. 96542]